jgi:hypothetical protein
VDKDDGPALVVKVAGAVAASGVAVADPVAGLVAAGLVPVAEAAVTRWRARQARNVEETLDVGATAAGVPVDDLLERLSNDPTRLVFLSEALTGAARSTYSNRIRALGRALATGALAEDTAEVDEERMWVDLIIQLEAPHVRALLHLDTAPVDMVERVTRGVAQAVGIEDEALAGTLLAMLQRLGLIYRALAAFPTPEPLCHLTPLGREALRRLHDLGETDEAAAE